jgi:hypothetical protein
MRISYLMMAILGYADGILDLRRDGNDADVCDVFVLVLVLILAR